MPEIKPYMYINLARRADRREAVEREFQKLGVMPMRINAIEHKEGWRGCVQSHIAALEAAKATRQGEYAMICEDDVVFDKSHVELMKLMRVAYEADRNLNVVMFTCTPISISKPVNGISKVGTALEGACYVVRKSYIPTLIAAIRPANRPLDQMWNTLQSDGWYCMNPPVAHQRPGFSDIENKEVDYSYIRDEFQRAVKF